MKPEHSEELNSILISKSYFIEKFGILSLITVLVLTIVVLYNYEHKEQLSIEKLEIVSISNSAIYKITLSSQHKSQNFNYEKFNLIIGNDCIQCVICTGISTNGKYLFCKSSNENDTKIFNAHQLSSNQDLYIETTEKYFDIIIAPFFNLLNRAGDNHP